MTNVSLLHLSDIHFKKKEKEGFRHFHASVQKKMIKEIGEHVKKHDVPDFTVITGDISFDGKEYKKAKEFFGKLRNVLPGTTFLPVPGNHDVDRDEVDDLFSLYNIVEKGKVSQFLENDKRIKIYILPKFKKFVEFVNGLNPDLYKSEDNYFWVKDFADKHVSFLGLNSAWACEGDRDRSNIALGYPQVLAALEKSEKISNKILLMHHPLFDWFDVQEFSKCRKEIFKNCSLILHGHTHVDDAFLYHDPAVDCICIGASASYTRKENCYIGFQFEDVEFINEGLKVKVWPYIFDERTEDFEPDTRRYGKAQQGKSYYDIDTRQKSPVESPTAAFPLEIPVEYREWIENFHSTLSIDQLSKKGEVVKISLPELYIHLETANPFHKPEKDMKQKGSIEDIEGVGADGDEKNEEQEPKEPAAIDIETLLGRVNCILLRGAAGMGKTTLIKHLAYTLTHDQEMLSIRGSLPVLVFLKDLWPVYEKIIDSKHDHITFESLLEAFIKERRYPLSIEVIKGYLSKNRVVFLLDGLDEAPEHLRPHIVEIIAEFQFRNKKNRFLITGRPHGIEGKARERFGKYLHDINPLDKEKIDGFITAWFRSISGQAVGLAEVTATDMIADVRHHEHISAFTQNPLLLTAVCVLYQDGKRLPEQRADLYERIVGNLLYKRFQDQTDKDKVGRVEECLMNLAFTMQTRTLKKIESYEAIELAREVFVKKEGEDQPAYKKRIANLFNEIEPHCGLLNRSSGGEVEFSHLTFQEFLAAKYMVDKGIGYKEFIDEGWWEETILLYIGLISLSRKKDSNDIVKEILENKEKDEKYQRRLYLLGSKGLRDIQAFKREGSVVDLARKELTLIIESGASLEERFEAGEVLGVLGDLRIKSVSDNMVKVEPGEFIRGSDKNYEREKPERKIYIDEFAIGRYPVTNEEYKGFVDDNGYKDKKYWTEDGWHWKEKRNIVDPVYWHDRQWNGANFPVVGISWYEASAYACWLAEKTGVSYRLPTEAEWEKAARGMDDRVYPWEGDGIDKNKCNYDETGLNRTSPVGIFSDGKSPYGCFDMSGNVWEWCADWFDGDYYKKSPAKNPKGPKGGSDRVIRGGSWFRGAGGCRASFRYRHSPAVRGSNVGFRLSKSL